MENETGKKKGGLLLSALIATVAIRLLQRVLFPVIYSPLLTSGLFSWSPMWTVRMLDGLFFAVVNLVVHRLMLKHRSGIFMTLLAAAVYGYSMTSLFSLFPFMEAGLLMVCQVAVCFLCSLGTGRSARRLAKRPVVDKAKAAANRKLETWRAFYEECAKFKIHTEADLKAADKHQRAELVAQKHNISFTEIEALFRTGHEGWDLYTAAVQAEAEAEMEKKRSGERDAVEASKRYAAMRGVEKRVAMLSECIEGYKALNRSYSRLINGIHLEKESDGAVMAGVAAGIGGVVPAVMSLNNTARMNEEIHRRNALPKQMIEMYVGMQMNNDSFRYFWEKERERVKTKLIGDQPDQEVFQHLTIETKAVTVTETGSIQVEATVKGDPAYTIFDKIPAIIDGTIVAKIHEGETLVGEALLSLPTYGTGLYELNSSYNKVTHGYGGYRESSVRLKRAPTSLDTGIPRSVDVSGYCLFAGQAGHTYTVTYEPGGLWGMEL